MSDDKLKPSRRGRPAKNPGGPTVRIELRTTPERKARAARLASAAGLTVSAWLERAIDMAR